jgi:hypothetical protein
MKANIVLVALAALFAASTVSAQGTAAKGDGHAHESKAAHGGAVTIVKDVNYELVAKADSLMLYVSDHGKPVSLSGASAEVTLLGAAGERIKVALAPAGDRLAATGKFNVAPGTKAVVQVALAGRQPISVRFTLK